MATVVRRAARPALAPPYTVDEFPTEATVPPPVAPEPAISPRPLTRPGDRLALWVWLTGATVIVSLLLKDLFVGVLGLR